MSNEEKTTLQMILSAAIQEFLEKGFTSASLRNIAKKAGVTTGALYGYYDSKEDLFEALVGEHYNFLLERFCKAQKEFAEIPPEEQPNNLTSTSGECMYEMLLYAYEHLNEFKLILCCSEGTRFSKLIDEMVEIETKGTHDYLAVLEKIGRPAPPIDERLEHILITALFERNERFLYRRVDENYGAIKMNKFVRAICPIIFIHRLVTANFTRATLTEMRILEDVHFVLVS